LNLPPIASSLAALIPGPSPNFGRRESALTPDPSPHSGRGGLAGFKDFLEHQADVGLDLFVPKPNNPITELFELARPLFILFSLQIMDVAINLKHQSFFGAVEIGDERPKRMLAAEFMPAKSAVAQALPKHFLGGRHFLTQFFSALLYAC